MDRRPTQTALLDDRGMADVVLDHDRHDVVEIVAGLDHEQVGAHDVLDLDVLALVAARSRRS